MKKEIEIQRENVNNLIKLMQENPTLKVFPMVNSEVVGSDDYMCWLGQFDEAKLDDIWVDEERIYFKSIDDEDLVEMELEELELNWKLKDKSKEELTEIAEKKVANLDWEKAIVVNITSP